MSGHGIELGGERLVARASGALWWPAQDLICVADLHLGKSERMARRGGTLLPPYETAETLARLQAEVEAVGAKTVVCLGDSFDDTAAGAALGTDDRALLTSLMSGRSWVWVAGNHDPGAAPEVRVGGVVFRHAAIFDAEAGEVSGHYHPKVRMLVRGRAISRRCFITDGQRMILPAFGVFTGGLDADSPPLRQLFGDEAMAILAGSPCVAVSLRAVAESRARMPRSNRVRVSIRG